MIISVASGKGGTGKTTVAVSLALSLDNVQFIDADAEEPNAHIFIKPSIKERYETGIPVPTVDEKKCSLCGLCKSKCVYNAIAVLPAVNNTKGRVLFFDKLCHGCGVCSYVCPEGAIAEIDRNIGIIEAGSAGNIQFAHGRLNVGEPMAPPVIRKLKSFINPKKTVIIDSPPGTSCPVVASVKDSNFCILVTEPTSFGLHDLKLAVELIRAMFITFGVIINRSGIGTGEVKEYCRKENIPVLMEIPFEKEIAVAYSEGIPLVDAKPDYKKKFKEMFEGIKL